MTRKTPKPELLVPMRVGVTDEHINEAHNNMFECHEDMRILGKPYIELSYEMIEHTLTRINALLGLIMHREREARRKPKTIAIRTDNNPGSGVYFNAEDAPTPSTGSDFAAVVFKCSTCRHHLTRLTQNGDEFYLCKKFSKAYSPNAHGCKWWDWKGKPDAKA